MNQALPITDNRDLPREFGINLIGHFAGNFGLGITIRAIAALLQSRGIPFLVYDVPHSGVNSPFDPGFTSQRVARPEQLIHPINLYCMNIFILQSLFNTHPELLANNRLHIANIWWEASRFPPSWMDTLSRFDGILAMSDFIAEICRNSLPLTPTLYGEHPLDIPQDIHQDRKEFGLPANAVVFVASLDPNADPARKNPAALISAFHAAFPVTDLDVRLVIRLNNAATDFGQKVVQLLRQVMQDDTRITLLLEPMNYEQILSLYACADVYLSFHRGEGLGLGMLESMTLGKPVIATGWSGNCSFMNHSNSALLRYRLIPVSGNFGFFRPEEIGHDARWAEPVLEDAVAWMRKLRHEPALREAMGAKTKLAASEYQQRANEARWISELNDLWQAQQFLPRVTGKFSFSAN